MADIVNLTPPELMIVVCNCGCSSFELLSDGSTRCSACDVVDTDQDGAWADDSESKLKFDGVPFSDVQGNKSVEFARRRVGLMAKDDDAGLVVVAKESGSIHAWCVSETAEQMEWMREMLSSAGDLIERAGDLRSKDG